MRENNREYDRVRKRRKITGFDDEENEMTALTLGSPATLARRPEPHFLHLLAEQRQPQPQPQPQLRLYGEQSQLATLPTAKPEQEQPQYRLHLGADYNQLQQLQFNLSPLDHHPLLSVRSSSLILNGTAAAEEGPSWNHRQPQERRKSRILVSKKDTPVPALYPWYTTERAKVQSMDYLLSNKIVKIRGEVECKRCDRKYEMELDLETEFNKIWLFIAENKSNMNDRAPACWTNPVYLNCDFCKHDNSARPVIANKKKAINWLFLLLGQLLGCCTLNQLKYFCKKTNNHRTGAKDRVLYLTYMELCKQLVPTGPFDPLDR